MLQISPVNPCLQSHLNELTPSTQTPPFKHSFGWQSSISVNFISVFYLIWSLSDYAKKTSKLCPSFLIMIETYFFHSQALYIQEGKYKYTMQLRPGIYHHCYKGTPYNHQCLQRNQMKFLDEYFYVSRVIRMFHER